MKKYLSFILLVLLVPILFLTGCNDSEPIRITLTKDNYNNYLSFNVVYEDFYIDTENNYMYCTARIKTHAIVDNISFEYCNITMNLIDPTASMSWHPTNVNIGKIKTSIDTNGVSDSTISLRASILISTNHSLPTTNIDDIKVLEISGQVIIN